MRVRKRTDTGSVARHDPRVLAVERASATVPGPDVSLGAMVKEFGEALSDEAAVLASFVADARARRPCAWRHVEQLKLACTAALGPESELPALRLRLTWLEAESQALQAEVRRLRARLAATAGAPPGYDRAVLLIDPTSPTP